MEKGGWELVKALGRAILHGAHENYSGRISYASKECEKHCERMGELKRRIGTLSSEIDDICDDTKIMHKKMLLHAETVKELEAEYSGAQKKAFDAYTKLVVFSCYSSRIEQEMQKIAMGEPSEEFRMLRNADQLI